MNQLPSTVDLARALSAASAAHHEYEETVLQGVRDQLWAGFYAAFVLGRLGDFASAGRLATLLEEVTDPTDWTEAAAGHVVRQLRDPARP